MYAKLLGNKTPGKRRRGLTEFDDKACCRFDSAQTGVISLLFSPVGTSQEWRLQSSIFIYRQAVFGEVNLVC